MPERKTNPTIARTNLARERVAAGLTQEEMANFVGLSVRDYRRLEGAKRWPLLAELVNCSLVLGVPFEKVAPTDWRGWKQFSARTPESPDEGRQMVEQRRGRWPKKSWR
ncbi:MAG TPA: helix-turn-helix transcriptional regulator [Gaiellaceae bacterium]|nr:helix-turn-helix transcriptional regulator [Gaiellaceae bacterium]